MQNKCKGPKKGPLYQLSMYLLLQITCREVRSDFLKCNVSECPMSLLKQTLWRFSEDGAEIKRQVCQRRITQALVDVYIANMISYDNHWQSLQFLQAHDLSHKCSKKKNE